jgi:cytochrome b involved in lipid metabolism
MATLVNVIQTAGNTTKPDAVDSVTASMETLVVDEAEAVAAVAVAIASEKETITMETGKGPSTRMFTRSEVAEHDDYEDCHFVIHKKVYDVTSFLQNHPGGMDVMMEFAGRDATTAFEENGHSNHAMNILEKLQIGVVVKKKIVL